MRKFIHVYIPTAKLHLMRQALIGVAGTFGGYTIRPAVGSWVDPLTKEHKTEPIRICSVAVKVSAKGNPDPKDVRTLRRLLVDPLLKWHHENVVFVVGHDGIIREYAK